MAEEKEFRLANGTREKLLYVPNNAVSNQGRNSNSNQGRNSNSNQERPRRRSATINVGFPNEVMNFNSFFEKHEDKLLNLCGNIIEKLKKVDMFQTTSSGIQKVFIGGGMAHRLYKKHNFFKNTTAVNNRNTVPRTHDVDVYCIIYDSLPYQTIEQVFRDAIFAGFNEFEHKDIFQELSNGNIYTLKMSQKYNNSYVFTVKITVNKQERTLFDFVVYKSGQGIYSCVKDISPIGGYPTIGLVDLCATSINAMFNRCSAAVLGNDSKIAKAKQDYRRLNSLFTLYYSDYDNNVFQELKKLYYVLISCNLLSFISGDPSSISTMRELFGEETLNSRQYRQYMNENGKLSKKYYEEKYKHLYESQKSILKITTLNKDSHSLICRRVSEIFVITIYMEFNAQLQNVSQNVNLSEGKYNNI